MATEQSNSSTPKLPLFSAPPAMTKYYSPQHSGILTPPLNTLASVPFKWEAQPGKPKPCTDLIISIFNDNQPKCLEPPPARLYYLENTKMPSPTTVLNGPYNNNKCTSLERGQLGTLVLYNKNKNKVRKSRGYWWQRFVKRKGTGGNIRKEAGGVGRGSFVFSCSSVDSTGSDESGHNPSVKMATLKRNARSHSHILASIYEGFKQVIPWKGKKSKK
ncbi:uncharacterized protein At4g00950-like isoform X1 [Lycium ferocissimum]|uniref:uncharacterized protein At4g00950-like isoform X1 n=1 Tax=Lycium ferocissimum TaxID=112874 RepID=UPI0028164680|nr:uncharacterized protein At4g00950-like isoform X1 [Lycium ferocissimum]